MSAAYPCRGAVRLAVSLLITVGCVHARAADAASTRQLPDLNQKTSAGVSLGEAMTVTKVLTETYMVSAEFNADAEELERITEKLDREVFEKTVSLHPDLREAATKLYTRRLEAMRRSFRERLERQRASMPAADQKPRPKKADDAH